MSNPEDPILGPNDPATAYHDLLAREAALETLDGRVTTLEGTVPAALADKLAIAANLSDVADPDVARDNLNAQEAGTSVAIAGGTASRMTGDLYVANAKSIKARLADDSADMNLIGSTAGNIIVVGTSLAHDLRLLAGGVADVVVDHNGDTGRFITANGALFGDPSFGAGGNVLNDERAMSQGQMKVQSKAKRTVADGVTTNASATVTSATAAFTQADLGMPISGTNIPANSFVGVINSATSVGLSSSSTTNTPVNATGSGTGITLGIGGASAILRMVDQQTGGKSWRAAAGGVTAGNYEIQQTTDRAAPDLSIDGTTGATTLLSLAGGLWPAFTGATLTNSWTNFGAPFCNASYRKSNDGIQLQLTGTVVGGASGSSAFTLPVGHRPTTRKDIFVLDGASGASVGLTVNTNGTVTLTRGAGVTQVNIDCILPLDL